MPVKGKVDTRPYDYQLKNMELMSEAYIEVSYLIITREGILLSLIAPIIPLKDMLPDEVAYHVKVKRIGSGFTQDDFELDFCLCTYKFELESAVIYVKAMQEEGCIAFTDYEIVDYVSDVTPNLAASIKALELEKQEAIKKQDYMLAAQIRDKITFLKEKNEN